MASIKIPSSVCAQIYPPFKEDEASDEARQVIRGAVKSMIEGAIGNDIVPARLPAATESGITLNITFHAKEDKAIRSLAKSAGIREGDAAMSYLYAALARGDASSFQKTEGDSVIRRYREALGLKDRHHQALFCDYLIKTLASKNIGLIEAATGVGKTLGIIVAAAETVKDLDFGRCVIAVPTIQLLRQFASQHRQLEASGLEPLPAGRFVVGRNEFIAVRELEALLDEGSLLVDPVPIRHWLQNGGSSCGPATAQGSDYMLASLREISPGFPVEAVRLTADSDLEDPGAIAYARQFDRPDEDDEPQSEIVYCTHAMLAADLRRRIFAVRKTEEGESVIREEDRKRAKHAAVRSAILAESVDSRQGDKKQIFHEAGTAIRDSIQRQLDLLADVAARSDSGLLPSFQYLIIDEAHAFESNMANALAFTTKLASYVRNIKTLSEEGVIPKSAYKTALAALKSLRAKSDRDECDLAENTDAARSARAALQELSDAFLSAKKPKAAFHPLLTATKLQAKSICTGLKLAAENRGSRAILSFSPVRVFPNLSVGRQSVRPELSFLWQTLQSAACVSATLYLRRLDKDSSAYSAQVLNIPSSRHLEFPVIRPPWTHEPVIGLWVPENVKIDGRQWLRPPSRRDKLSADAYAKAEQQWMQDVALAVKHVFDTAEGGVLVLLGSYATAKGISSCLGNQIDEKITASQDSSLHDQMSKFVEYGLAGRKAIWLAVGGAWTGVDINGANHGIDNPSDDLLLTDLVIPRFPFGLNRSMTHRARMESMADVPWELLDASMRFKQGIGRLVRRPGLKKNRRIFVLDGRCNDPIFENYLSHLRRIMNVYPNRMLVKKGQ